MSELIDNPRNRRKAAQVLMSEVVYRASVLQQISAVSLYVSSGKPGLSSAEKHASIAEMRQAVEAAKTQSEMILASLTDAAAHLDKAQELYGAQVEDESSLKDVSTPEDFLKLTGPASPESTE